MNQYDFWSPIIVSLQVTLVASIVAFILALFASWMMRIYRFRSKSIVETIILLPLVLPPSVVGFGLLVLFGRNSWVGRGFEWLFHQPIIFTKGAAVLAAVVVAFPLIYMSIKTGFDSIDSEYEDAARSMGANEWSVFKFVSIPLAWRSLLTGYILGFARGIGEFGATLMFAGNIPGKTQTIPTAIYVAVESGNMTHAYYWVLTIVLFSFLLLFCSFRMK
ncbi:molybdate ABC transporter permease subunit [Bacillus carboniphilus]|uniref:Molybdenum transport system permease n=1 Tax=Bacillus carboniphilus TaxID=86663 RepID=A0ABP3FSD0_9BACI